MIQVIQAITYTLYVVIWGKSPGPCIMDHALLYFMNSSSTLLYHHAGEFALCCTSSVSGPVVRVRVKK
jgi:hypothetical protein